MKIARFEVSSFRNLSSVQLDLGSGINLFYGDNGAGKTSLLEAIYFLGMGRSFRSRLLRYIISHDYDNFTLFARVQNEEDGFVPVGVERTRSGVTRLRIAENDVSMQSELVRLLPLQLIDTKSYRLLDAGPKYRRQFIDWGVFHVEHTFLSHWQKMQRALKQRNAILKQKLDSKQLVLWDQEFVAASIVLHKFREQYIAELSPVLSELAGVLLAISNIVVEYCPGWDVARDLQEQLVEQLSHDLRFGFTGLGPQKADLLFKIGSVPVQEVLSRGQQKLLFYALQLAQGLLLYRRTGKSCIYLIDDLPSELDKTHRQQIATVLSSINAQACITGIEQAGLSDLLDDGNLQMFHVKQGAITSTR